ncbi:branched-chain amino acid ABC transporter permease [Pseudonocardia sp.]|uniref:branched-chain amino acid ABC transporter permease n=1 Tax=Pseudonocardia sp. TaxID=60912 RepID=UPI002630E6F6|nr:branched-chain amino acid ABC transporter permease [Pseudonocardia sp.]
MMLAGLAATGSASASTPAPPPDDETSSGIAVNGTLRNSEGTLLEGVTVTAVGGGGSIVVDDVSGPDGRFEIEVPEPGTYLFRVEEDTLPEGTEVLQGEVTRDVAEGRLATVIFRFGEERGGLDTSAAGQFVRLLVDGIRFGLVIGIAAVGLSLIFGTTGLTNFAHGDLVTIGAVVAWTVNVVGGVQLIPATIIAIVVGGFVGALNEWAIWRRLRRRGVGLIAQLVVSIGLAIALRYLVLIFFGGRSESFADYTAQTARSYGPVVLTDKDLSAIVISIVVMIGVALLLQRTRIGKAMRAVSDNRDLAASSGIDVDRVVLFVWILGGALATLGGVLFALSELSSTVQYEMGFKLLLLMFAGVILGGLGTAYGALVGCLIVGILVQMSTLVLPVDLKYLGGLVVLIVILVFRPQGLLGSRARIG